MSDPQRFDPRFDPAFQPGYRGEVRMPRSASTPPLSVDRSPIRSKDAEPALPEAPTIAPSPAHPIDQIIEPAEWDPEPAGRNPFLITLLALAAIFVAAGLWISWQAHAAYIAVSTSPAGDYGWLQLLLYTGPLTLVLGLATGVVSVALLAARWERRNPPRVNASADRSAFR